MPLAEKYFLSKKLKGLEKFRPQIRIQRPQKRTGTKFQLSSLINGREN